MFASFPQLKPPLLASSTTTCISTTKRSALSRPGKKNGGAFFFFPQAYCFEFKLKKTKPGLFLCTNCVGKWGLLVFRRPFFWTTEQLKPGAKLICSLSLSLISPVSLHWLIHPAISSTYLSPSYHPLNYCLVTESACSSYAAVFMFIKHDMTAFQQPVFTTSYFIKMKVRKIKYIGLFVTDCRTPL